MKNIHCIIFGLFGILELAFANNESAMISITVTAEEISDVSVDQSSLTKTLNDIFDLRDTSNSEEAFDDITITYQTNMANQNLTLSSNETHSNNFYLHHADHTASTPIRLLLNLIKNNTKITPNDILISNTNNILDDTLTITIKLKPHISNAANSGEYMSTLTVAWMSTG